jgi:tRNA threonylcarbamoyl adenosine modification protein YjeE
MESYHISSPEQMVELGTQLVNSGHKKFWLIGQLGAGKTHFSKWVALGLGINPDKVHSPTYVYFHEYDDKLLHVDMYRMTDKFQITKIGLHEKLEDYDFWCIERPRMDWIDSEEMLMVEIIIDEKDSSQRLVTVKKLS